MPKSKKSNVADRFGNIEKIDDKYRWYQLIQRFIKELNMKEKDIYKMNYKHGLNWLSMWYQRDKVLEHAEKNRKK